MDLFNLFAKISLDSSEYDKGIENAKSSGSGLANTLKSGLASAGSLAATGIGAVVGAATAAGAALLSLEESTEEYRIAQGKLNTAFEAAGMSAEAAKTAYNGFYTILGDTDTATEASQLLAKLATSEEDLSKWTNIAAGVYGTFGDSLPVESMIEAANETAKVGTVTGTLADALNWAGISEDEFNAKLAEAGSEAERNQLIMDTLSATYSDASDAFYRNNEALVSAREAQAMLDESLASLGQTVSNVKTNLISEFLPSLAQVAEGLVGMLSGTEGAEEQFSTAIGGLINTAVEKLPEFLNFGVQILTSIINGIVQNIPALLAAVPTVVTALIQAIQQLFPTILETGGRVLEQVATGIVNYIPQLVGKLPDVILAIINFLSENFPTILQKGTELLINLATGIINEIPNLVDKLPQIITAITGFIANNLPLIATAGINLLVSLIGGILGAIPDLVAALPEIITAIVEGIAAQMESVVEAGINIVEGLWEGITSMGSWIKEKVSGFVGGIIDSAKETLGINSPSKVFSEMGEYSAEGYGVGWSKRFSAIKKDIANSLGAMSVDYNKSALGTYGRNMTGVLMAGQQQQQGGEMVVRLELDGNILADLLLNPFQKTVKQRGVSLA